VLGEGEHPKLLVVDLDAAPDAREVEAEAHLARKIFFDGVRELDARGASDQRDLGPVGGETFAECLDEDAHGASLDHLDGPACVGAYVADLAA
jgi:hypothetical protein